MTTQTEKFEVRNRWTGAVQFTAEIECRPDALPSIKLGSAVRWGRRNDADLRDADLSGADLRQFKADLWMTLTQHRAEVPGLITALRNGKVDGSTYTGTCACLVGTLAKVAGQSSVISYAPDKDSSNPAEQWFMPIRPGDKPGDDSEGAFRAAKALEWAEEYCRLTGIDLPDASSA